MNVIIIDGQGGGIGKALIENLKDMKVTVVALGTNEQAAIQMKKAGAHQWACGEKAIIAAAENATVIMGALGIIAPGAMDGEITPGIAVAIAQSPAKKILIPVNKCNLIIAGTDKCNLTAYIQNAVDILKTL